MTCDADQWACENIITAEKVVYRIYILNSTVNLNILLLYGRDNVYGVSFLFICLYYIMVGLNHDRIIILTLYNGRYLKSKKKKKNIP